MRFMVARKSAANVRIAGRGFTILELLVVLAVVSVLMGLLLPAIATAKRFSRTVACASNLRQIGIAHQHYLMDSREQLVDAGLSHGSVPSDLLKSWLSQLSPYMDTHEAMRSPADVSRYWSIEDGGEQDGLPLADALALLNEDPDADLPAGLVSRWSSYALNIFVTDTFGGWPEILPNGEVRIRKWSKLHMVPNPSGIVQFLMLTTGDAPGDPAFARSDHVDSDGWLSGSATITLQKAAAQSDMSAYGGRTGTWEARANYLYLDGRVETQSFREIYENVLRNRLLPIATPPQEN